MGFKFLLREDMPPGFRRNPNYAELPAAVAFLKQYEGREFETKPDFEKALGEFQDYLRENKVPESSDKALREGLLMESVKGMEGVFDVKTRSNEGRAGKCWFGSFGPEADLRKYFQFQEKARIAKMMEDDD